MNKNPTMMICPKCHRKGRIDEYHPSKSNKSRKEFVIVHGFLPHFWGTTPETEVQARERCYMIKPAWRDQVLKRLGMLIA